MSEAQDWTEDFKHENGHYYHICSLCDKTFEGHKRRRVCKLCQDKNPKEPKKNRDERLAEWAEKLSEELREENTVRNSKGFEYIKNASLVFGLQDLAKILRTPE